MYKLELAVRKSDKVTSRISWSLIGLVDVVLNMGVAPTELSVTNLTGRGKGGKGPSYPNAGGVTSQLPTTRGMGVGHLYGLTVSGRRQPC